MIFIIVIISRLPRVKKCHGIPDAGVDQVKGLVSA